MHAFDVLGDPVRRRILELLAGGEQSSGNVVEVISEEFGIGQPAVSMQLKVLRESGFATVRADGRRRLYAIDSAPLAAGRRLAVAVPPVLGATAGRTRAPSCAAAVASLGDMRLTRWSHSCVALETEGRKLVTWTPAGGASPAPSTAPTPSWSPTSTATTSTPTGCAPRASRSGRRAGPTSISLAFTPIDPGSR